MAIHRRAKALRHYGIIVALLLVSACNSHPEEPNNALVCQLYAGQGSKTEVFVKGTVQRVLGDSQGPSGVHEGYLLQLRHGCDVLARIETNETLTGHIPLHNGESVEVKGEYEYTPEGGVIHWTHRARNGRHINGYVYAGGKYYQ